MLHHHACVGPLVTYSVVVAVALGLSVLTFGCALAWYAARSLWRRLGEAEDAQRVRF